MRGKYYTFHPIPHHMCLERLLIRKVARRVTQTYMFPYKEDLCRFDFEVDPEDEYMCGFGRDFGGATPKSIRSNELDMNQAIVEL